MTYEPLNRRLATLAAVFAFLGVILGVIALATNFWTINTLISEDRNATGIVNSRPIGALWNVRI